MAFVDIDALRKREEYRKARARRKQDHVGALLDKEALDYIKEYFECDKCVFSGEPGSYDPMDAMRRDAYREVYLRLRGWHARWKKANN